MRAAWLGWGAGFFLFCILFPAIWVEWEERKPKAQANASPQIRVYLTKEKQTRTFSLEDYVAGVVAAEMPVDFHLEALKAQALAARTYIARRLAQGSQNDMKVFGPEASKAFVTDTVKHQVFSTPEKLRAKWGAQYEQNRKKIEQAVKATQGQVITYQHQPIYAAFFSTSNGYTENSEEYFKHSYPYLRSVPSPWDREAERFKRKKVISFNQFSQRLGQSVAVMNQTSKQWMKIKKRTTGHRVASVQIGDRVFTGREVREALQLPSSDFDCKKTQKQITCTTQGYGHGVGMSQWGANLLAQRGKKVHEIIRYYYRGTQIETWNPPNTSLFK